jgi:SAM-dependent methyltransferase
MIAGTIRCRSCAAPLHRTFVDLGATPLANAYLDPASPPDAERWYPLHARVCENCLLVQIEAVVPPENIFSDYAYFSSYSTSWLEHARRYAETAVLRWHLGHESLVIEVASNDGYLLQYFAAAGVSVLGVEPAANVAAEAVAKGVPTRVAFLGAQAGAEIAEAGRADLVVANNVLAHVPDINDFVAGLAALLAADGVLSIEFPHLLNLIRDVQFDTIYHEHFSYLSLHAVELLLSRHGLRVFDVEPLPTHGGSLRVLACHGDAAHSVEEGVAAVRAQENAASMDRIDGYTGFAERVRAVQSGLRSFLAVALAAGDSVVAYGAAAKGNTLLNSCGVTSNDIRFVVDRSPHKQGRLLPGSRLPIRDPAAVDEERPDYLLILAWNLADEVVEQMRHVKAWGTRFVVPIPEVRTIG